MITLKHITPTIQELDLRISELDPFPKLTTFPEGWNLDAILNPSPAQTRSSQPLPIWHESFPELHTYPSGWVV
jgi:hypothetical protein